MEQNPQEAQIPLHPPPAYEINPPTPALAPSNPATTSSFPPPEPQAGGTTTTTENNNSPAPAPAPAPAPTHVLTFHHTNCSICSSSTIFEHTITTSNYFVLCSQMTSRVYDLLDLMHPDECPVVDGDVRLMLGSFLTDELNDLATLGFKDRATLLEVLVDGVESYRLEVRFETVGMQAPESAAAAVVKEEEEQEVMTPAIGPMAEAAMAEADDKLYSGI